MKALIKILLLILLFAVPGCRKDDNNHPIYVEQHFKDTFDYKAGTYWIFYDSLNGANDTFTITATGYHAPVYVPNYLSENSEYLTKMITDTGDGPQLTWSLTVGAQYGLSLESDQGLFDHGLMYGWPFTTTKNITFLPVYSDMGHTYNNVYYSKSTFYGSYVFEFECWFSPDAGFVTIKFISSLIGNKSLHVVNHYIIR